MPVNLINVSNRLPVTVGDKIEKSSGGLVAALEGLPQGEYNLKWIGWPGSIPDPAKQDELGRVLTAEYGCLPVFLSDAEVEGYYAGFSNSSLWPILHYMPNRLRFEPAWWDHYRTVNRRFAETVLSVAGEGDLVWIHDYHLMLLPAMLREARPDLKIGFFLHTPFPSYEVFRCHPRRTELLSGLLGADQLGFHTYGYARHFRSSALRLLGLESEINRIRRDGRSTLLGVYPIGINAPKFEAELASPAHAEQLRATAATHAGKKIVLSVERLDYTKGLLNRLDAIDIFLSRTTDRESIKFIFISVPSREDVEDYRDVREEVEAKVGRLNGKYATVANSPISFIHGSVSFNELCVLYSLADIGLVTPVIDGMNLVAKEYVACQGEKPGVLILSEFAGAAAELFSAVVVNPYDATAVADAIGHALEMSDEEKRARMEPMRRRVMQADARHWAQTFIRDLTAPPSAAEERPRIDEARLRLSDAFSKGRRVAFFLDYDGTLRELERDPAAARPTPAIHALLQRLAEQPNLDVTIISGRRRDDLESFLGSYPFALIAEHGASIRRTGESHWEQLDRNVSYAWKDPIRAVLRQYEQSTPGSFVEEKRSSLVWHYRKADPEFGNWKAKELLDELVSLAANEPVRVQHGRKIVEVTATQVSKGAAIMRLLEDIDYDLILAAGDDQTDESMFELNLDHMLSIKIGDGDTRAQYRLPTPASFRRFLQSLLESPTPSPVRA